MNITELEFLQMLADGKSEKELNKKEGNYTDWKEVNKLVRHYGHTAASAVEHLQTDYSNGFTICKCCGSYYHLGKGFTKHLSNGCLTCEGQEKHRVYHVNASRPDEGGFPARWMCVMFDDGLHYCKDKLQAGRFADEVKQLV